MKKNNKKEKNNVKKKNKMYLGFGQRLAIYIGLFVVCFAGGLLLLSKSFDVSEQEVINYRETSNIDYKVYLKPNEFYSEDYLGKNMVYIASLIKSVNTKFNYTFTASENVGLNFEYSIVGKLRITDSDGKNSYFEKEYVLLDKKSADMTEGNSFNISESIDIDYNYYNSLANRFKMTYGLDTDSNLSLFLVISKKDLGDDQSLIINNTSLMSMTIPLSEKAINISMDYKEIDNTSNIISNSDLMVENIIFLVISCVLLILSLVLAVKSIRLLLLIRNEVSQYDKYVNRLLTVYDRLIVETSTCPELNEENVIKIENFEELLDVRDNLKCPIMYYVVTKHQKGYFYIINNDKIYLNVVKDVDLNVKNNVK